MGKNLLIFANKNVQFILKEFTKLSCILFLIESHCQFFLATGKQLNLLKSQITACFIPIKGVRYKANHCPQTEETES